MPIDNYILSYVVQEEKYNHGEAIIREGSSGDWVYLVLEGTVKIKKNTPKGMVTIHTLTEGHVFGEVIMWRSGKGLRTASVIADTDVKVGVLDTDRLMKDYESISPRLKSLFRSLVQRLIDTTDKAVILAVDSK